MIASVLALGACAAPTTMSPAYSSGAVGSEKGGQTVAALQHLWSEDKRLQDAAWRLSIANVPLCPRSRGPVYGIQLWNAAVFDDSLRPHAVAAFDVGEMLTISNVIAGSPADRAGLKVGERVTAADGVAIPPGKKAVETYAEAVDAAHKQWAVQLSLTVEGAGGRRDVVIPGAGGCLYPVAITSDDEVNAFTDGYHIYVTRGMMRFARDERDLAVILGHEMAHNVMNHSGAQQDNAMAGGALGLVLDIAVAATTGYGGTTFTELGANLGGMQYSTEFELEADYVGAYLMRRAGYDIATTPDLWRRLGVEYPETLEDSYTHPAAPERLVALEATVKEIQAKEAAGQPLTPNLKPES
jgi:hypothetical protein